MAALSARLGALTRERNELINEADALRTRIASAASRLEQIGGATTTGTQDQGGPAVAPSASTPSGNADDAALRLLSKVRRWPRHVSHGFHDAASPGDRVCEIIM